MEFTPLHIIHLDQDDPKKCTAKKMEKYGNAILHNNVSKSPKRGFLLNPRSNALLGPDDKRMIDLGASLVALDCSWKQIDDSLDLIKKKTKLVNKSLPLVLAANEVSWGKPGRLSTVEAFAISLWILGRENQAKKILQPFRFGKQFLELNKEPLVAYSNAKSNEELEKLQWDFFNKSLLSNY
ncbi:MAG: hypothetical protein CMB08_06530 [Euryarchaeota archaeon]|nr:hypothetical protein [Euryarchaeota archaeon]